MYRILPFPLRLQECAVETRFAVAAKAAKQFLIVSLGFVDHLAFASCNDREDCDQSDDVQDT
jgi:hypothetical protein